MFSESFKTPIFIKAQVFRVNYITKYICNG